MNSIARNEYIESIIPWLQRSASAIIRRYGSMNPDISNDELVNESILHCSTAIDKRGITNNFVPLNRTVWSSMRYYMFKEKKCLAEEDKEQCTPNESYKIDLHCAINALGEKMKAATLMKYYGGMTSGEIGKVMNINPAYVRELQGKALSRLHDILS